MSHWWVHCKHCVLGEKPAFDANDFTVLFFSILCVLTTAPLLFAFKQWRWPLMLVTLSVNAFICIYFIMQNIWL